MSRLLISCPHCDRLIFLKKEEEEKVGQCPGCYGSILIPQWALLRKRRGKKIPIESFEVFCCPNCQKNLPLEDCIGNITYCPSCEFPIPFPQADSILLEKVPVEGAVDEGYPLPAVAVLAEEIFRPKDPWRAGQILNGKYRVLETLGRGGMGNIYLVHHLEWNISMVVKTPLSGVDEEHFRRRMQKWIYFGRHPNIITAIAVETLFGRPRLFLEYVEGNDLAREIKKGPFDLLHLIDYGIQICRGMGYVHRKGMLHRDLKPANLIIEREEEGAGVIKITDFGWMRQAGQGKERLLQIKNVEEEMGILGEALGTPPYMAPEQFEDSATIGPAADIYAFGVILYEMCCGRRPFSVKGDGLSREDIWAGYRNIHNNESIVDPSQHRGCLPVVLCNLIKRCLEKDPANRPSCFEEIQGILEGLYLDITQNPYDREDITEDKLVVINLNNRALGKLENGKADEARQLWSEALKSDPSFFPAAYNLNLLRCREGEIDLTEFCKDIERMHGEKYWESIFLKTFVCLERGGMIEESLEEIKEAQLCYPEEKSLVALEGELLYRMGRYKDSAAVLRQICRRGEETSPSSWFRLGCAYLENNEKEKTNWSWNMGLERDPNHPDLKIGKAFLYAMSGDYEKAKKTIEKALQDRRESLWGLMQLAEIYRVSCKDPAQKEENYKTSQRLLEQVCKIAYLPRCIRSYETSFGKPLPPRDGSYSIVSPWSHINNHTFPSKKCIEVSMNGRYIIMIDEFEKIRIWDMEKQNWHTGNIETNIEELYRIAVSQDGRIAVTGSSGNTIKVWDLTNGACTATFKEFTGGVSCIHISSNGRYMFSGTKSSGTLLWMWDVLTEGRHATFEGHKKQVSCVALTFDESRVVTGSLDNTLRLWDVKTQRVINIMEGHTDLVTCVQITRDGSKIVSGSKDKTIRVWDLETGKPLITLEGHEGAVLGLQVTPDSCFAISGSEDSTLRVWDIRTGVCITVLEGHEQKILSIGMSEDGRRVVSVSNDETCRVWEDISERLTSWAIQANYLYYKDIPKGSLGHNRAKLLLERAQESLKRGKSDQALYDFWRILELDGYRRNNEALEGIAQAGVKGRCKRRHLLQPWEVATLTGHQSSITNVEITPDGKRVISGSRDSTIRIWNIQKPEVLAVLHGHSEPVTCTSITADGRFLLSGSRDKTLRLWDLTTYQCLAVLEGHAWGVQCVALSPDGAFAVSGGTDRNLIVWDINKKEASNTLVWHTMSVDAVAMTTDGALVISGSSDKTLRVWSLFTGERCETLKGHEGPVTSLGITPDSALVISGSSDKTLRIWDLANGTCKNTLKGHTSEIDCLTITQNGRYAISGSLDRTLRVWDLSNGTCCHVLYGHRGQISGISLTPDSLFALSSSTDRTIKVWSLQTGECHATLHGRVAIECMAISSNGRFVVSGHEDGSLQTWELEWQWEMTRSMA